MISEFIKGFSRVFGLLILIMLYCSMADLRDADAATSGVGTPAKCKFSCAIAKSAYGSPSFDEPVKRLRAFRDHVLMGSTLGRSVANVYYRFSGSLASQLDGDGLSARSLRLTIRAFLSLVNQLEDVGLGAGVVLIVFLIGRGTRRAVKASLG
jgi:hypothetical protein